MRALRPGLSAGDSWLSAERSQAESREPRAESGSPSYAATAPAPAPWDSRWVHWPDFRLPRDPEDLRAALAELLERAGRQRVEVACRGGTGRTGTALACLAVLDGLPADRAVGYVREHYRSRAVETRGQRAFVGRFG